MKYTDSSITKYAVSGILFAAALGILLGLFLLLVNVSFLLKVIFVVIGLFTVLTNLPGLLLGMTTWQSKEGKLLVLLSLFAIVIGVMMMFLHNGVLMIVLGIYFIISPLLRVLFPSHDGGNSQDRMARLRSELPKLILGVVMLLLGPAAAVSMLFRVAGWVVIALTVIYTLASLLTLRKSQHKTGPRVFVDTDGDGKIDTLYVDTTGDGKADTATRYRDDK